MRLPRSTQSDCLAQSRRNGREDRFGSQRSRPVCSNVTIVSHSGFVCALARFIGQVCIGVLAVANTWRQKLKCPTHLMLSSSELPRYSWSALREFHARSNSVRRCFSSCFSYLSKFDKVWGRLSNSVHRCFLGTVWRSSRKIVVQCSSLFWQLFEEVWGRLSYSVRRCFDNCLTKFEDDYRTAFVAVLTTGWGSLRMIFQSII